MSKRTSTWVIRMMPVVLALILWTGMSGVALAGGQGENETSAATAQTPTETIPQTCPGQQTDPTVIQQLESYLSGLLQLFGMTATYECAEPVPAATSTPTSTANSTGSTNPAASTVPTSTEPANPPASTTSNASTESQTPTKPPACTPVDAATATQLQTYITQILQLFGLTAQYQQAPCQ